LFEGHWGFVLRPVTTLSCLVLWGAYIQLSICLLTLPAVYPILTPWNCTFTVLPCRCGQIRRRCVSMCADACRCGN